MLLGAHHPQDKWLLLSFNVVLSRLEMAVEVDKPAPPHGTDEDGADGAIQYEPPHAEDLPWKVRKGTWSQTFQDGMKVSAFAARDWYRIKAKLRELPNEITREDILYVPPPPVLGKREAPGAEGGRGGGFGGRGRGRGGRGRGGGVFLGGHKWVRTEPTTEAAGGGEKEAAAAAADNGGGGGEEEEQTVNVTTGAAETS